MEGPIPDDHPVLSKWHSPDRWKNEDREFDPLSYLIAVGAVLMIVVLLLVAMQFAIVDPEIRFGLLMLGLGVAAIVLISRSYRPMDQTASFAREERQEADEMSALQSTVEYLDLAFEGNPFGQMVAMQELKDLLIDRLVLTKRMSRSEIMEMATDPIWLEAEVSQAELRYLLTAELKLLYAPELSGSVVQNEMISAFPNNYIKILNQLEEM